MIRLRITPTFTESGVRLTLDWVGVIDEQIQSVVATEEFAINANRQGCAYVTRGGFEEGTMMPGTFWIDEANHRHFVMAAEPGHVGLFGGVVDVSRD